MPLDEGMILVRVQVGVPNNVSVVSMAARQPPNLLVRVRILPGTPNNSCNGGGEAQRKSLQNSKTVSSNLTRCSNQ
jgi:hypothetical protein